jgi:glutamate 5-kinase
LHAAQILLTAEDMAFRALYLNARATMRRLLTLDVVPVVNENDAIAAEKLRFGDNDRLAALIANLIEADVLAMLTDSPGIYRDPAKPDAGIIRDAPVTADALAKIDGASSAGRLGVGGMKSKIAAAKTAARSGAHSIILGGKQAPAILARAAAGEEVGTFLYSDVPRVRARKRWLAENLPVQGALEIDAGAMRAVCAGKRSLLPIGVVAVSGDFRRGDAVALIAPDKRPIARGLVNYDADEAAKIARRASGEIEKLLGYMSEEEIVHRDNLALL